MITLITQLAERIIFIQLLKDFAEFLHPRLCRCKLFIERITVVASAFIWSGYKHIYVLVPVLRSKWNMTLNIRKHNFINIIEPYVMDRTAAFADSAEFVTLINEPFAEIFCFVVVHRQPTAAVCTYQKSAEDIFGIKLEITAFYGNPFTYSVKIFLAYKSFMCILRNDPLIFRTRHLLSVFERNTFCF